MFIYREWDPLGQKWVRQYDRIFTQDVKRAPKLGANLSLACSEISGVIEMGMKLLNCDLIKVTNEPVE